MQPPFCAVHNISCTSQQKRNKLDYGMGMVICKHDFSVQIRTFYTIPCKILFEHEFPYQLNPHPWGAGRQE